MKYLWLTLVVFLKLQSQNIPLLYNFEPHKIPITNNSELYQNPFAGGIDNPRFQFVDIDNDNDLDLFIIDRDDVLQFYECENPTKYKLKPTRSFAIQTVNWVKFVDIDNDGDLDCFGNNLNLGITFNKNIGTKNNPIFQTISSAVKDTIGNFIQCEFYAVPSFVDIDGDGDFDLFAGTSNGQVTFYENIGTANNFSYRYVTDYWQQLNIQGSGLTQKKNNFQMRHGSCVLEFFDSDSNGTLDLFWGDFFNSSLYYLQNIGTTTNPKLVLRDSTYPKESPIKTAGFNMTQHVDYDGDSKIDLIVGSLFFTQTTNSLLFYKNIGTNKSPFYKLISTNILTMLDVGSRSFPAFCDLDLDGDEDLIIGSDRGNILLFKNITDNQNPKFLDSNIVILSLPNLYYVTPTAGDLDGDGKPDLLIGDYTGSVRFYKNISQGNNINFTFQIFGLDTLDVGYNAAPYLSDITNDSLLDLLIGNSAGKIIFLKNVGTKLNPKFEITSGVTDLIDVGTDATPSILNYGNKKNLISGNSEGAIKLFTNIGTSSSPQFSSTQSNSFKISTDLIKINSAPVAVNLSNKIIPDLFVGNGKGGILYYSGSAYLNVDEKTIPNNFNILGNYPNPFNSSTSIKFELPADGIVEIDIYSILGEIVESINLGKLNSGSQNYSFVTNNLASGVYYYSIKFIKFKSQIRKTNKMVLIK